MTKTIMKEQNNNALSMDELEMVYGGYSTNGKKGKKNNKPIRFPEPPYVDDSGFCCY